MQEVSTSNGSNHLSNKRSRNQEKRISNLLPDCKTQKDPVVFVLAVLAFYTATVARMIHHKDKIRIFIGHLTSLPRSKAPSSQKIRIRPQQKSQIVKRVLTVFNPPKAYYRATRGYCRYCLFWQTALLLLQRSEASPNTAEIADIWNSLPNQKSQLLQHFPQMYNTSGRQEVE